MMMNGVWSKPPAGRIARLTELGAMGDKISEGAGESSFVCRLSSHPGWLYKAYRSPTSAASVSRLDQLIALPGKMSAQDRALVEGHTAWPAARVVNPASQTTGVLLPAAPEAYKFDMALPGGRSVRKYLEVDLLALSDDAQRQRGLPPQSLAERIAVCASIVATADLLERHGLVYLDWSYANIFWRPADSSAYLIDMDGSSFGARPQIQTPQWDDPQVPLGTTAGNNSDRYRVALLVTSCLTGKRVYEAQARTELSELRKQSTEVEHLAELLLLALTTDAASRPPIARMKAALDAVNGARPAAPPRSPIGSRTTAGPVTGGVAAWKPIGGRAATTANPSVTPPAKPVQSQPAPARPVRTVPPASAPAAPAAAGRGGSTGSPVQPSYQSRTPARPASSGVGTVVKTAVVIIALIILIVIIAHL